MWKFEYKTSLSTIIEARRGLVKVFFKLQKQNNIIQHDICTQEISKKATFISKEWNVNLMSNDVT